MAPLAATKITAGVTSGIESCTEAEKCKQQTKSIHHSHRNKTFWLWRSWMTFFVLDEYSVTYSLSYREFKEVDIKGRKLLAHLLMNY